MGPPGCRSRQASGRLRRPERQSRTRSPVGSKISRQDCGDTVWARTTPGVGGSRQMDSWPPRPPRAGWRTARMGSWTIVSVQLPRCSAGFTCISNPWLPPSPAVSLASSAPGCPPARQTNMSIATFSYWDGDRLNGCFLLTCFGKSRFKSRLFALFRPTFLRSSHTPSLDNIAVQIRAFQPYLDIW